MRIEILQKNGEVDGRVDEGSAGLQRLFHGAEGDALQAVGLEGAALGVVADDGCDAVDAYLDGFLDKPFHAGVVFGGGHGHVQLEGSGTIVRQSFGDLHLAGRGVGVDDAGPAHRAVAAGDIEFVARLHAEDTDAVFRLVGREGGVGALGGVGQEEVHFLNVLLCYCVNF